PMTHFTSHSYHTPTSHIEAYARKRCQNIAGLPPTANLNLLLGLTDVAAPGGPPTEAAAYGLLAPQPHARTLGASVPIRDRAVAQGSACGSDCHETRRQPRALRLLAGEAWEPPGAGTNGHRARRHSRRAGR